MGRVIPKSEPQLSQVQFLHMPPSLIDRLPPPFLQAAARDAPSRTAGVCRAPTKSERPTQLGATCEFGSQVRSQPRPHLQRPLLLGSRSGVSVAVLDGSDRHCVAKESVTGTMTGIVRDVLSGDLVDD